MSVKLKPISVIKASLGIQPNGRVQKFFTNTCAKHMDKYVPYMNGDLSLYKIESNSKIIYDQPYAHYMYKGLVMGPNIPIKDNNGNIIKWISLKSKPKYYTGKKIDYSASIANGHTYAGPEWDKRMWSAESSSVIKETQNYVNHGG